MGSAVDPNNIDHIKKVSRQEAEFHRESVADLLHRNAKGFPGAQPVSFARRHLRELQERDYFLAEKTDGARLLLYLASIQTPDGQWIEAQFLIDRKNEYYYIEAGYLHIPPLILDPNANPPYNVHGWHKPTLIDGELVLQQFENGKKQLTYLMFDCLAYDGDNIMHRDFSYRLGKLDTGIAKGWRAFSRDWPDEVKVQPFHLAVKKPEVSYAAPIMFDQIIPKLPHGNDGLIFTCKDTPYTPGTDHNILKWKPPHENTIDFRVQLGAFPLEEDEEGPYEDFEGKPEIELLVYHGGGGASSYKRFDQDGGKLWITDSEWEAMKKMGQKIDWRIMECWREHETGHWRPKIEKDGTPRYRDDKDHANHASVVESVLESIRDAVSEQDLKKAYEPIRNAWKERERRVKETQRAAQQQEAERKRQMEQPPDDGPRYED